MDSKEKEYQELGCKDFGSDSNFMVRAETAEEVAKFCQQHACSVHDKCGTTSERIKSRIRSVKA